MIKQTLGWPPKLRDPAAADRGTWLLLAGHAQLRLTRPLAQDSRGPWGTPAGPGTTHSGPGAVGVSELRATSASPALHRNRASPVPAGTRCDVGLMLVTGPTHQRPAHHTKGTEPRRTG
ncbi:hypothetical protein Apa02nite_069390 [Actinoplanes palleronii]|uniref:Uncharacterized protein n=1 Tax=Actinoplanes palleronii TaxID=113570 RepID=A0ABQ4BJI4_9ACTN|nr:hypothetical protein Apa02nite_069390 [Actinoplanes palleronii]